MNSQTAVPHIRRSCIGNEILDQSSLVFDDPHTRQIARLILADGEEIDAVYYNSVLTV